MRSEENYRDQGFTLIELLVVFAIIGILTSLGLASFTTYTNNQSVLSTTGDVLNMLTTAKTRSISQVKPSDCGTNSLTGYKVSFANPNYTFAVLCGSTPITLKTQALPTGVTFASGTTSAVTFDVLRGTSNGGTIIVTGFGKSKTITVTTVGTISSN